MLSNSLNFTGTGILALVLVFLVGIILMCLGLIALYIANIHAEVVNRPLYVEKRRQLQVVQSKHRLRRRVTTKANLSKRQNP